MNIRSIITHLMLLNVYLLICDDVKEEKNNTQVFIP